MKQLTVPELKLFSGETKSYNEYRYEQSGRRHRDDRLEEDGGRYKNDRSKERLNYTHERVVPAERQYRTTAALVNRILPRYIEEVPRCLPIPHLQPIPIPIAVPFPPPPHILPLLRAEPPSFRHSRVSSVNLLTSPTDKYYEITKQVLYDVRHSPHERNMNIPSSNRTSIGTTNRTSAFTQPSVQQHNTFSIKKDPYLSQNTQSNRLKIFPDDGKNKGIQLTTNDNPKPKPATQEPSVKPHKQPSSNNLRQPSPPKIMVHEADQTNESRVHSEEVPEGNIENYSNKELLKLFKDVLEHERINFEQYREEHERDWIGILDYVNRLKREDQQRQLRKKIRQWKKRIDLPLQDSIIENVSTYSDLVQNDSVLRRDLRQIDDRRQRYQTKIEEKYAEIDEYDFTLQRNMRENKHTDLGQVIRIKNEEMQLYRDCVGSITKLIERYEKGAGKAGSSVFSYFE